ncbi:MAG TPA: zf-HC2 domain-containing protein [Anaerolineae bacterium]|nr:zf-HC2 domain-containing protein [Anaerolineae bacterium]
MSGREPGRKTEETGHDYVRERLSAYLDGQLLGQERQTVEEHLAACSSCRWDLQTLRQTVLWTRNLPTMPVPRSFTLPVPAKAPARAARPRWRLVPAFQLATAMVALLLFFAVAGDLALTGMRPASMPAPSLMQEAAEPAIETTVVEAEPAEEMMALEAAPAEPAPETMMEKAVEDAAAQPPVARLLPTEEAPMAAAAAPEVTETPADQGAEATVPPGAGGALPEFEDTPPPPSEGEGEQPSVTGQYTVPETVSDTLPQTPVPGEVPVTAEAGQPAAEGEATLEMETMALAEPSATPEPQPTAPPEPLATPAPPLAAGAEPYAGPTAQVEVEEPVEALAAGEPARGDVDERAGEREGSDGALQAQATNWLRIVEYALAAILVLLVGTTAALMAWRRRSG